MEAGRFACLFNLVEELFGQGKELVHTTWKTTLEAINQMQADGIIGKYAIGGAVGATLYLEPAATLDVEVFVVLPTASGSLFTSLAPLYDYLKARGGTVRDEYIVVGAGNAQTPHSAQLL